MTSDGLDAPAPVITGGVFGAPSIRKPDATDRVLAAMAAEMRHEHRMQEIREMDIEAWARRQMREQDDEDSDRPGLSEFGSHEMF